MSSSPTMHPTLRIVVIGVLAVLVLGSAMMATTARTYSLQLVPVTSYAIWDDRQLVVFVHTARVGTEATVLQRLRSGVGRRLFGSYRLPARRLSIVTTVVRLEDDGRAPKTTTIPLRTTTGGSPDYMAFANWGFQPRFFDGRPLVLTGFWNGTDIEAVGTREYAELMQAKRPDEPGHWHSGSLMRGAGTIDLPVSVCGEAVMLRSTQTTPNLTIDLIRTGANPQRIVDLPLGPRAVSQREFDAMSDAQRTR